MEDNILKLCKRVLNYGVYALGNSMCDDIACKSCIFSKYNNKGIECEMDTSEHYIQIAQNYIKEHENTVNTINSIEEQTITTLNDLKDIKENNILPTYYHKGNYDVIQFCNDNNIDFISGNIIKYITRYKGKNGIEDLKKAKEYLRRLETTENAIFVQDISHFCDENNLSYAQGKIIECVIENNKDLANILINNLIKYEEKKGEI